MIGSGEPSAQVVYGDRISELGETDGKHYIDKPELISLLVKYHSNETNRMDEEQEQFDDDKQSAQKVNMTRDNVNTMANNRTRASGTIRRIEFKEGQEYKLLK